MGWAKPLRTPNTLIIDFGGVMTTDLWDALRGFASREVLPREAAVDLLTDNVEGREILASLERGDISQIDFECQIGRLLGVSPANLVPRMLADLAPDDLILKALERTRSCGTKIVVLSNTWGLDPYDPYKPYDLSSRADVVIYSEVVKLRKPDPAIFNLALDLAATPASSCVFVDDIAHNLTPAQSMGIRTIHHVESRSTIEQLAELGL